MNVQVLEDLERWDTYLLVFATVMMVGREAREGGLPRLADGEHDAHLCS